MLEALSMYYGGEVICATDCNYSSSRELGIVCPICSEALFLRAASKRTVRGKEQLINPYFAHYHTGADKLDCEKRAITQAGRDRLNQLKSQARNQRLKLYNQHLWEMLRKDRAIAYNYLNRAISIVGRKKVESRAIALASVWKQSITLVYQYIDLSMKAFKTWDESEFKEEVNKLDPERKSNCNQQVEYFNSQVDTKLHTAICYEITDFLATNTGGYALHNFVKAAIALDTASDPTMPFTDKAARLEIEGKLEPDILLCSVTGLIAGTHWIEQLQHFSPAEVTVTR